MSGGKTSSPAEIASWASDLSDKFLQCREMGHTWKPWTASYIPADRCYERILRCTRCYTRRQQTLTSVGAVTTSQYIYPEGYQHKGFGRITGAGRDALRLESVTRLIGED